jgi:hypothetical protein
MISGLIEYQSKPQSHLRLIYQAFFLIIPFSSFAIHQYLPFPPVLLFFLLGSLVLFITTRKILATVNLIIPLVCIVYFSISQIIIGAPFDRWLGVVLAICFYMVTIAYGHNLTRAQRKTLIDKFYIFSLILLTIEATWRMTHPDLSQLQPGLLSIYQYKMRGLMYADSNVVGFHLLMMFSFLYYEEKVHGVKREYSKIVIVILLFFSFSRAAWIAAFIGWLYVRFLGDKKMLFYLINALVLAAVLTLIYDVYLKPKIQEDLSFQSKLDIVQVVLRYFERADPSELVFGIGFSNSLNTLGIYAHNFFMVYLIESGGIGLFLILLLFFQFIATTNKKALFLLIPFLISSSSNTVTFIPYFYVMMGLMYLDQREAKPIEPSGL